MQQQLIWKLENKTNYISPMSVKSLFMVLDENNKIN
jgi:hypothetical protein